MFLQESERLAAEQPELRSLIEQLDARLQQSSPSALFRAEDLARFLHSDVNQVEAALAMYADADVLRGDEMVVCPDCDTLMSKAECDQLLANGDEAPCSACERDLARGRQQCTLVYRKLPSPVRAPDRPPSDDKSTQATALIPISSDVLAAGFLRDVFQYTPLLRYYSNDSTLRSVAPFANMRVIYVLHFLRDLLPFVEASIRFGLRPENATFFYKSYPYPQRDAIAEWLRERGAQVRPLQERNTLLAQLGRADAATLGRMLIVEDGGYFVPEIHRTHPNLADAVIGAVEQTARGIWNVEEYLREEVERSLSFPVLSVATCKLKGQFEAPYIGRAVVDNVDRLLSTLSLAGRRVAVLGYGSIGREVARALRSKGAVVAVSDKRSEPMLLAKNDGMETFDTVPEAIRGRSIIIGCSGSRSINSAAIADLGHGTILVSGSSEQYEIDVRELEQQAIRTEPYINAEQVVVGTTYHLSPSDRQVHLIANGYPINFWGLNSMPDEASDLIMTLLFLAAVEVAQGHCPNPGIDAAVIDELAGEEKYGVAKKYLEFHKQG